MTHTPSAGRAFPDHVYLTIRAAFRRLTAACGGQEAAAAITRADHQRISRYGRVGETMFAPIDVVADLERDAGQPLVTRELADLAGYLLVAKPAAGAQPVGMRDLAQLAKETGDAVADLADALADVDITAAEASRVRVQVREAMEVMARIDAGLAAVPGGAAR